jgi:AcrR family transcriptional regulator
MPRIVVDRPPETRELILESFINLVEERGAFQIVFQDIADASKMSLGSIRYYFKNYDSLVESAIAYVFQRAQVVIEEDIMRVRLSGSSTQMIRSYVEANFRWMDAYPSHAAFLSYFYHLCCTRASVVGRDFWQRGRKRVEALILEEVARTKSKGPSDVEAAAQIIHSLIFGSVVTAMAERSPESSKQQLKVLVDSLPSILLSVASIES